VSIASLKSSHWRSLPADPLAPRDLPITAWTGHELLAVGGQRVADGAAFTGADAYDPQTGRWELLPSFPLAARDSPASAWTGYGLVVWGGSTAQGSGSGLSQTLGDGAILDPAHRVWRVLPAGPLPPLTGSVAVTDGADNVIILGGVLVTASAGNTPVSRRVASYDPARRTWRSLPDLPVATSHELLGVKAVLWGSRVLVAETWQQVVHTAPGETSGTGGVDLFLLDPRSGGGAGHWSRFPVPSSTALIGADVRALGSELVVAGGTMCPPFAACPYSLNTAFGLLDAQGNARAGIFGPPIKLAAETVVGDSYVVMTGSQITGPGRDEQPGDAAAFNLASGEWVTLPSARRFKPEPQALTWTGRELIALSSNGSIALGPN
jgi:hypothetical protein